MFWLLNLLSPSLDAIQQPPATIVFVLLLILLLSGCFTERVSLLYCLTTLISASAPTSNPLHFSEQIPEEPTDKDGKKTWKGKVAKQWKKMQQGPGATSTLLTPYPEGGSIGEPNINYFFISLC